MNQWERLQHKMVSIETAKTIVSSWKTDDKKVVFTNGCFDILHKGHVSYLAKAADLGDYLVIGINADSSVKKLNKGENRPINDQQTRATVLSALEMIDLVVIFEEETPLNIIKELAPSVLVKGGDYNEKIADKNNPKYIVGSDIVKENNGEVFTIPLEKGFSTTSIIEKIKG